MHLSYTLVDFRVCHLAEIKDEVSRHPNLYRVKKLRREIDPEEKSSNVEASKSLVNRSL